MDDEGVTADRQVVTGAVWEPSVVAFFFCCLGALYIIITKSYGILIIL